eukprot:403371285
MRQQKYPNQDNVINQIEERKNHKNEELKDYEQVFQGIQQSNQQAAKQEQSQEPVKQDFIQRISIILNNKKLSSLQNIERDCYLRILKSILNFDFLYYFVSPSNARIRTNQEKHYCVRDILSNENTVTIEQDPFVIPSKFPSIINYVVALQSFLHNEYQISQAVERPLKSVNFQFDSTIKSHISCRLILYLNKTDNMFEKQTVQIEIPYRDENIPSYTGVGCVYKVQIGERGHCRVLVDINIRNIDAANGEGSSRQVLPQQDPYLYLPQLNYCILKLNKSYHRQSRILEKFEAVGSKSTEFIKKAILTCEPQKAILKEEPQDVFVNGLPKTFSSSQFQAVQEARVERLKLIQGPPGTGKTLVTCAIVANWFKMNPEKQILICAPSNAAADLIAERLQHIDILTNKFIRFYSESKEDIFNLDPEKVKPFTIMHRMIFMSNEQQEQESSLMLNTRSLQDIKQQVEYYFSDYNYYEKNGGDSFLQDQVLEHGCVPFNRILQFNMMRYVHHATLNDLNQIAPFGINYELYQDYGFRKRQRNINNQLTVLGMDISGIRNMSQSNFDSFMDTKRQFEKRIIDQTPIIITTCNSACEHRLKDKKFRKVIIDEAAQATEVETLIPLINAKQVVLIGDHKQLGPVIDTRISGPDSLFKRLINSGYPHVMLSSQYRMHPFLLQLSNRMFYNNKIENEFSFSFQNFFIHKDRPLLFIDVNDEETRYGSSFYNEGQALKAQLIYTYLITKRGLNKSQVGVISPYNGQTQKLRELISFDPNIVNTIDSWQGKEQDYIIFTAVRNNLKTVGFLKQENRTNVAMTRAKHGMIIIGNRQCLSLDNKWKEYLNILEKDDAIVTDLDAAYAKISTVYEPEGAKETSNKSNQPQDEETKKQVESNQYAGYDDFM